MEGLEEYLERKYREPANVNILADLINVSTETE